MTQFQIHAEGLISIFLTDWHLQISYLCIYTWKLPWPSHIIKELTMIVSVIIRTVCLCMIARRQSRHLVTVYRITAEKMLHLVCHLRGKNLKLVAILNIGIFMFVHTLLKEFITVKLCLLMKWLYLTYKKLSVFAICDCGFDIHSHKWQTQRAFCMLNICKLLLNVSSYLFWSDS